MLEKIKTDMPNIKGETNMDELILTNIYIITCASHSQSHYRIPVLVLDSCDRGFGPSQPTYPEKFKPIFGPSTAASVVYSWALAHEDELSDEEFNFIKLFLGQWPEGPQLA